MTGFEVRPATAEDVDALTRLHVEGGLGQSVTRAWQETYGGGLRSLFRKDDQQLLAFVAVSDGTGEIVSAAVGFIHQTVPLPSRPEGLAARLASLATLRSCRRQGCGTAVTSAFIVAVRERGCAAVFLNATQSGAFLYRNLGFAPVTGSMRLELRPPAQPAELGAG